MKNKHMNHKTYPETLKSKTWAELRYIAKDAKETLAANPDNDNAGYYADEINYVCSEMHVRKNLGDYGPRK
jgi:hypothetical protein